MAQYCVLCEYLEGQMDKVRAGKEVILEIHDLDTFERKIVRALISDNPEALTGASPLSIEEYGGDLRKETWAIKVLEELDPDQMGSKPVGEFRRGGW